MEALDCVPYPAIPAVRPTRRPQLTLVRSRTSNAQPTGTTPRTAQDHSLIRISFEVYDEEAPALRSAIEEISNEVGGRLEGMYKFDEELALTQAVSALGKLRAAVNAKVADGATHYRGRRR